MALMAATDIAAEPALNDDADTTFPAIVEVQTAAAGSCGTRSGPTPGSPEAPWGREDVVEKFVRFDRARLGRDTIDG